MCFGNSFAQITLPASSPTATFSQKIGLTDVSITYSRPSKNERKIFGSLVPYGKLWRTGANMATQITFSDEVKVAGQPLAAGTYALFTIPGEKEWTVIFNKNYNQGGTGNYSEAEDALRVQVESYKMPEVTVQTFLINIEDVKPNAAMLELLWDDTVVPVPIEVSIDERIMTSIEKSLKVSPDAYQQAAIYYHQSGKDLNQALEWMNKAIAQYEADNRNVFWVYRQKSLLLADMKKYDEAIATAKTSLAKAREAGNDDYVKMNSDAIAEWGKK
ncbi:MAG: DUF2911 domain-containing protein [Cyclobacteriaceae bacterium]|nr:DUF2911 domain-containing protein [Cyclobacteriaceae bacterium]